MGLAAGQARLLTITGRKSDCEFESMRLSHQKIALARELADLSNEYQNSLVQNKLIYDYYGTGDTSLELSYGIMMNPSSLNDYKPILLTDSMNRVVLNSTYASVAQAAGIPREGTGTLPSEVVRNNFINALADAGLISEYLRTSIVGNMDEAIIGIPYNQGAGFGADTTVTTVGTTMTLDELCGYIDSLGEAADFGNKCAGSKAVKNYTVGTISHNDASYSTDAEGKYAKQFTGRGSTPLSLILEGVDGAYTIGDIIRDYFDGQDIMVSVGGQDDNNNTTGRDGIFDTLVGVNIYDQMFDLFESLLNNGDAATELALLTAREKIQNTFLYNPSKNYPKGTEGAWGDGYDEFSVGTGGASCTSMTNSYSNHKNPDGVNDFDNCAYATHLSDKYDSTVWSSLKSKLGYVGVAIIENNDDDGSNDNDSCMSAGNINLSTIMMAYLTELYIQLNGTSAGDYYTKIGTFADNKFIDKDVTFTIYDTEVSSEVATYAGYYDTLFNMICQSGWTENANIDDNNYLKTMLQNGMVYISKQKDDRFYYQNNYATDSYIKEIADERLIARAEANYNTEKAKLNAKEETLDLKMKNLDTEISALTTEYDTVKNTISKQIEKSFKRYNA